MRQQDVSEEQRDGMFRHSGERLQVLPGVRELELQRLHHRETVPQQSEVRDNLTEKGKLSIIIQYVISAKNVAYQLVLISVIACAISPEHCKHNAHFGVSPAQSAFRRDTCRAVLRANYLAMLLDEKH